MKNVWKWMDGLKKDLYRCCSLSSAQLSSCPDYDKPNKSNHYNMYYILDLLW